MKRTNPTFVSWPGCCEAAVGLASVSSSSLVSHALSAPLRSTCRRLETESMVKPGSIRPTEGPCTAVCCIVDIHRMPYLLRLILFLFCLMALVGSRKPRRRRWTGQLDRPKPRYVRGRREGTLSRNHPRKVGPP